MSITHLTKSNLNPVLKDHLLKAKQRRTEAPSSPSIDVLFN